MTPYSQDLRQRVVDTVQRGEGPFRQIARAVPGQSLLRHPAVATPPRAPARSNPSPTAEATRAVLTPEDLERLRELIRQRPDATLEECRQRLGVSCSLMTISRALSKLGLPRKKKVPHAAGAGHARRSRRNDGSSARDSPGSTPDGWSSWTRCGANTAMTRTYGRAPRGSGSTPIAPGHWESITLICGMRLSGVTAPLAFPGATNTGDVRDLRRGGAGAGVAARRRGDLGQPQAAPVGGGDRSGRGGGGGGGAAAAVQPGLTPIEEMFSKVKGALRSAAGRTKEAVYEAFGSALHDVTLERHRGMVPGPSGVRYATVRRLTRGVSRPTRFCRASGPFIEGRSGLQAFVLWTRPLVDPLPATEPAGLSELVRQLGREVLQLRQEVDELRRENAELRQQVGYWKAMHARAVHRADLLEAELEQTSRREPHAPRSTGAIERIGALERGFSSPTRSLIIVVSRHTRRKGDDHAQAQTQPTAKAGGRPHSNREIASWRSGPRSGTSSSRSKPNAAMAA